MRIDQIFNQEIHELRILPENPKVFWYPSAGNDFRGNVFLTEHQIRHWEQYNGKEFIKPDLFIYNCLGKEVQDLRNQLNNGEAVLREDNSTTIIGSNYIPLGLKPDLDLIVNPNYIEINHIQQPNFGNEAFYFELEIIGHEYNDRQKVIYIEHENIDTFNKIVLGSEIDVSYLCAIREGMGFGNCRFSIVEHIYCEGEPDFFINSGFRPRFNFLFTDYTHELFEEQVEASALIDFERYFDIYITDINDFNDTIIYKIDYHIQ